MYKILFFKDKHGREPIKDYLTELASKNDKNSRANLKKISEYISILAEFGTYVGEPILKHLDGDIWELRPMRNRILFAAWEGDKFVLLHMFVKKTQKTPKREIETAKRNFENYKQT